MKVYSLKKLPIMTQISVYWLDTTFLIRGNLSPKNHYFISVVYNWHLRLEHLEDL